MAAKNYNKDEVREAVLFCGTAVYTCGSLWLLEIYSPLSSFKLEQQENLWIIQKQGETFPLQLKKNAKALKGKQHPIMPSNKLLRPWAKI